MADLTKTGNSGGTNLAMPADFAAKLAAGIAESRANTHISGGKPFLRLLKDGIWVYGAEDLEVEPGAHWAVNIMSLVHGWCCWVDRGGNQKNELVGEEMVSMTQALPPRPLPIENTPFSEQRGFELKCMTGEDQGTEVVYKTGSVGGMRAVDGLLASIQKALAEHPQYAFPVLTLEQDSYQHTKWGKTYVPVMTLVGWADMNGTMMPEVPEVSFAQAPGPDQDISEAQAADPPKRRRGAGKPAEKPAEAVAATPPPVSTTQAHAGQRRRPGR
jgi:hypothetical protein